MADPVITDPVLLAAIAILAAQDNRPDAAARGDAAAVALATAGLLTSAQFEEYKALTVTEKSKAWAAEKFVDKLQKPSPAEWAAITALYESLYPEQGKQGFADIPWAVLKAAAILAAQQDDTSAVEKGGLAAQAMVWAGEWGISDYSQYLDLTPAQRMAFWASGGDRANLGAAKAGKLTGGQAAGSSSTAVMVIGGIGALWLLSKMFGKGR